MSQQSGDPITVEELVSRISSVASLPDVYMRVKRVLEDPASSHQVLADALRTDPGISARLLRIANSAFYGRPGGVDSITRAVGLLGTQQVHDLVLATSVMQTFDALFPDSLKPREFWQASVLTATAAKLLAEHCGFLDSERLFVAGLLSQVGHLVLLEELPVQMGSILNALSRGDTGICAMQRQTLGFDYAQVGAALFTEWQLPAGVVGPIAGHTDPESATHYRLETAIVHISVGIASAEARVEPLAQILRQLSDAAWARVGLSPELFDRIRAQASELATELAPALLNHAA